MTLIKEYLDLTKKFTEEYGECTIILMQNGAFFEVYGLKNGHNITKADMDKGVGYIDIMRYNLKTLREGLSR